MINYKKLIYTAIAFALSFNAMAQAGNAPVSPNSNSSWSADFEKKRDQSFDNNGVLSPAGRSELEKSATEAPDEFAKHFAQWKLSKRNTSGVEHLNAAYTLNPSFELLWPEMMQWSNIQGDKNRAKELAIAVVDKKVLSLAVFEYGRNTLASVQPDGILLVNGGDDSYGVEVLQHAYELRQDVMVVDLSWIQNPKYLEFLKSRGITIPPNTTGDEKVFQYLTTLGKPLYLGLTVNKSLLEKNKKNLYCTGLALMYSTVEVNNAEVLQQNFEWRFTKKCILNDEPLNRNYVLPLCELITYFRKTGTTTNKELAQNLLRSIAEKFQLTDELKSYLK
jgi:hypothetical protein